MTTAGRDPAVQAEIDRAVRELARRLRPWVTGMADVDGFAAAYLEWLAGQGLRLMPRSEKIPQPGHKDPQTAHRGAELARDLYRQRTAARIRGETDG